VGVVKNKKNDGGGKSNPKALERRSELSKKKGRAVVAYQEEKLNLIDFNTML
jgi:hypothetical protein